MRIIVISLPIAIVLFFSCSSTTTFSKQEKVSFEEDLSVHQKTFSLNPTKIENNFVSQTDEYYPKPKFDITSKLNNILDSIDVLRTNTSYVYGYTIQVYVGNNREEAKNLSLEVKNTIRDVNPIIEFDQPNFKVSVGNFYSRIEAYSTLTLLKDNFPMSIIIPRKIYLKNID